VNHRESELGILISNIQDLNDTSSYRLIYELLETNCYDYNIKSDPSTKKVIESLMINSKPNNTSNYSTYHSVIKYNPNIKSRGIHSLKKLLTYIFNDLNNTNTETKEEIIKRLNDDIAVLTNKVSELTNIRDIEVSHVLEEDISNSLILSNISNTYDLDIFSSMKQKNKETDLIISRTSDYTEFAAGLLKVALSLPRGSVIFAKGGDGATRFVRLLQGAGDLIKASKELWSVNEITLCVVNLSGNTLRMNVDSEASQIIQEGINQTITTLINQGKTKSNPQVITSTLGALLRAGYPLSESINRLNLLLDTEKTIKISEELALRAILLMNDGRVNKWHLMGLCPNYDKIDLETEIKTLIGIGRGNNNKRCKSIIHHEVYLEAGRQCIHCNFNKTK